MTENYAARLMRLFAGFPDAHGTHGATSRNDEKGGKLEIRKSARTVREPVTEDVWREHLAGRRPLGIIPVRADGTASFGCVDVDQYDLDLADVVSKIRSAGFPMIACRSKSGGAHVFVFFSEPTDAGELRAALRDVAARLGWGGSEIFPKQDRVNASSDDLGSWVIMPYQGGDQTDQYAVKEGGVGMTVGEFLTMAERSRTTLDALRKPRKRKPEKIDVDLSYGPPCLQHLAEIGFPDGQRNSGLLALAIFCKKAFVNWREKLEEYNRDLMSKNGRSPVPAEEVADIIRRIESKDYNYSCKNVPLVQHCNSSLCRTRKFGVGAGEGARRPVLTGLRKLETDPPIWFLDMENETVELSTEELQDYRAFQRKCMNTMSVVFGAIKPADWMEMVGRVMEDVVLIDAPVEAGNLGHFLELLEEFLTNRYVGKTRDDLTLGKPWYDEESGRHYFRLGDLMQHLERSNFRAPGWGRNSVSQRVVERGGKHFFNIRGKGVSVFYVEKLGREAAEQPLLPEGRRSPI